MYVHEISIDIRSDSDRQEIMYTLAMLTGVLRKAGLTQGREPIEYLQGDRLVAVVYAMEEDSLHVRYHNQYVQRNIADLEQQCDSRLAIKVLGKASPDDENACRCATHPYFVLFTHCLTVASPVVCGACDRRVPLYKIPGDEGSHYKLLQWQSNYQACDDLQINCQVGERWAMRQMQDVHSQLSKQGRQHCAQIEEKTGIPTYYYLFNYRNITSARDRSRPCPNCGNPWHMEASLHERYEFMCVGCRLISSESPLAPG